jgi:hypothetical protein
MTDEDNSTHDDDGLTLTVFVGRFEVLAEGLLRAAGRGDVRLEPAPADVDPSDGEGRR